MSSPPFAGLQPVSVPFSGTADAKGNFTFTHSLRQAFWTHTKMAATCSTGNPLWVVSTAAGPVDFGRGLRAAIAPILLAPGDIVTVAVSGATAGSTVQGQFVGAEAPDAETAMAYSPSSSSISVDVSGFGAINLGPAVVALNGATTIVNATIPTGAVAIGCLMNTIGTNSLPNNVQITGNQTGTSYMNLVGINNLELFPFVQVPNGDTTLSLSVTAQPGANASVQFFVSGAPVASQVNTSNAAPLQTSMQNSTPALWQAPTTIASGARTTVGTTTLVAATVGQTIRVWGIQLECDQTGSASIGDIQDSTGQLLATITNTDAATKLLAVNHSGVACAVGAALQLVVSAIGTGGQIRARTSVSQG